MPQVPLPVHLHRRHTRDGRLRMPVQAGLHPADRRPDGRTGGDTTRTKKVIVHSMRGKITDTNGTVLAQSVTIAIIADPWAASQFEPIDYRTRQGEAGRILPQGQRQAGRGQGIHGRGPYWQAAEVDAEDARRQTDRHQPVHDPEEGRDADGQAGHRRPESGWRGLWRVEQPAHLRQRHPARRAARRRGRFRQGRRRSGKHGELRADRHGRLRHLPAR